MGYLSVSVMALQATVFAASSVGKALAMSEFVLLVRLITGRRAGRALAAAVALSEALVVVLCGLSILGVAPVTTPALLLAAALLMTFVLVMRGRSGTPCRCFGRRRTAFSGRHVVRNVLLTALAVVGLVTHEPMAGPELDMLVAAILAGAGAGVAVIVMDDLLEILGRSPTEEFGRRP